MYFVNESVNSHVALSGCMDSLVDKVNAYWFILRSATDISQIIIMTINELSRHVVQHSLPDSVPGEMRTLLVHSCHRISKARDVAMRYLNRLISSFPSLMCDAPLVYAILEVLTMLRRACEGEYTDEVRIPNFNLKIILNLFSYKYDPVYNFHSDLSNINLQLSDSYTTRNEMLSRLHMMSKCWFELALARAPIEFQATLQVSLNELTVGDKLINEILEISDYESVADDDEFIRVWRIGCPTVC